jgi:hypothetical protein
MSAAPVGQTETRKPERSGGCPFGAAPIIRACRSRQPGAKRWKRLLLGRRSLKRIGRLHPSISAPIAQQPGTPEPPGSPPQPPPDPTAPRPYEEPPRPIPIPRPDEPPVIDDPIPRHRRFRDHPRPHGGIAPRARGNQAQREGEAAGPAYAAPKCEPLAAVRDQRGAGTGPPIEPQSAARLNA